jgi:hypothetical protein
MRRSDRGLFEEAINELYECIGENQDNPILWARFQPHTSAIQITLMLCGQFCDFNKHLQPLTHGRPKGTRVSSRDKSFVARTVSAEPDLRRRRI